VSYRYFVDQVRGKSGLQDNEQIERAIAATLSVLGERLRNVDARAVAEQLPPELARHLRGRAALDDASDRPSEASVVRVCAQTGVGLEEMRVICRVLAETLNEQGRAQLRMQPLSSLFVH
jgi:uncharacterized protein (DUF2267 family)